MATRMQQRRGTAAQWISTNSGNGPVLNAGEIGFEIDNNRFKIGDGVNHWIDLPYFSDNAALTDLIDGAPDLLNTLGELAAAMGDDPELITNTAAALDVHIGQTLNVHGIEDMSLLATQEFVNTTVSDAVAASTVEQSALAGVGLDWNVDNEQFDVDDTIAREGTVQAHILETMNVHGIANTALLATTEYADDAVSTHQSDTMDIHGIADTAELATKEFAASLLVGATKTNISITGDKTGLTIVAENGVSDSTTDELAEGTNNLYFSDERAQDAVGNAVGTGLEYVDATGAISVDTSVIQERVAGVSDTEIGYLDGVTSDIQTQLDTVNNTASLGYDYAYTVREVLTGPANDGDILTADGANGYAWESAPAPFITSLDDSYQNFLYMTGNALNIDGYGLLSAWTKPNGGIVLDGPSGIMVDTSIIATQTELDLKAPIAAPSFTGDANFESNVTIEGNLIVEGTTTTVNTSEVQIDDPIFYLSANQYDTNVRDIGITGAYGTVGGDEEDHLHTGLVKDVTDGKWKLFSNAPHPINNVIDFTSADYDTLKVGALEATSATIGDVSNTEIQYLNGVTSAIQTQIDTKAPIADPTFTGTVSGVTKSMVGLGNVDNTADADKPISTATQTALDTKLASLVAVNVQTASYTLVLSDKDKVIEMNIGSANTLTVPLDSSVDFPIGTQIDILQVGSGQTTVVATGGVTVNATPGLKLRTQWAGATLRKRAANTWVLVGDLTA
jgi:hypothetical protein